MPKPDVRTTLTLADLCAEDADVRWERLCLCLDKVLPCGVDDDLLRTLRREDSEWVKVPLLTEDGKTLERVFRQRDTFVDAVQT